MPSVREYEVHPAFTKLVLDIKEIYHNSGALRATFEAATQEAIRLEEKENKPISTEILNQAHNVHSMIKSCFGEGDITIKIEKEGGTRQYELIRDKYGIIRII